MSELLDREEILELLELLSQLGARLHARGIQAEVYVVGGTAMVLAYDRTRVTRDVDAVTDSQDLVEQEARSMAGTRPGLSPDWFNDRVRPLFSRTVDVERVEAFTAPGIPVSVASPRHMLAMKVRAARGQRDLEDIILLCRVLGLDSIAAVLTIADDVWGPGMLPDESVFAVSEGLRDRGFVD